MNRWSEWMGDRAVIAALAEWMHRTGYAVSDIVYMIRKPWKFADEYEEMVTSTGVQS